MSPALDLARTVVLAATGCGAVWVGMAMAGRHRHGPWTVVGSEYAPPINRGYEGYDSDVIERMLYGFTTVTYRCDGCGDHRTELLAGKAKVGA